MTYCYRTERIEVKQSVELSNLCRSVTDLYNKANYLLRQEFTKKGFVSSYIDLWDLMKNSKEYTNLPGHTAQQTLRRLRENWTSFFKLNKKYTHNPSRGQTKPKIPKYKSANGQFTATFTANQARIRKDGTLKLPKKVNFTVKTRFNEDVQLKQVRVVPKGVGYTIEIIYQKKLTFISLPSSRKAAIDLGYLNIITLVDNIGSRPIIVKDNGKGIKSIVQYFNKKSSELSRCYGSNLSTNGKKFHQLKRKFELKKLNQLHKLSSFIIQECSKKSIGTLVIGYNKNWKQRINFGRKFNQLFVQIPFLELIEKITYKAEEKGIKVVLIEESYTSKCSFLDNEPIKKHTIYKGKRIKRGVFQSANGVRINADVNAAYNILLKSDPQALPMRSVGGVGGYVVYPFCYKPN